MSTLRHSWTAASFWAIAALTAPQAGFADEPQIKAGDVIVALCDTHLHVGTEKLAPVEGGTELVAMRVQDDWIAVTVERDGRRVSGWIRLRDLIANPQKTFLKLTVRFESRVEWAATEDFKSVDKDANGDVGLEEFIVGTRCETLDDLNEVLKEKAVGNQKMALSTGLWLEFSGMLDKMSFKSWKRKPTQKEVRQLVNEFFTTGDISRSPLAQQLVDREDTGLRSQMAQALFKWADKNRDGKLALEEFKQALPQKTPGPSTTSPGSTGVAPDAHKNKGTIQDLIAELRDEDIGVQLRAAEALKEMGPEAKTAIPTLIELLKDEDISLRFRAIEALKEMGPEAKTAIPTLIGLLKDEDISLRFRAIEALEKMGPEAKTAIPTLIELLKDADISLRFRAIEALEKMGPEAKEAIPALTELLDDENVGIRQDAKTALTKITSDR